MPLWARARVVTIFGKAVVALMIQKLSAGRTSSLKALSLGWRISLLERRPLRVQALSFQPGVPDALSSNCLVRLRPSWLRRPLTGQGRAWCSSMVIKELVITLTLHSLRAPWRECRV
jgi:hypothetical protein